MNVKCLVSLAALAALAGCTATVHHVSNDPNVHGLRYRVSRPALVRVVVLERTETSEPKVVADSWSPREYAIVVPESTRVLTFEGAALRTTYLDVNYADDGTLLSCKVTSTSEAEKVLENASAVAKQAPGAAAAVVPDKLDVIKRKQSELEAQKDLYNARKNLNDAINPQGDPVQQEIDRLKKEAERLKASKDVMDLQKAISTGAQ